MLLRMQPSPVVELNRAVAVAMARGNAAGLKLMDELEGRGEMRNYAPLPAALPLLETMGNLSLR